MRDYKSIKISLLIGFLLCCALLLCTETKAQTPARKIPKEEVRAVWITTVLGLDWPKSTDSADQKKSLLSIIKKSASAKFNTLYFQVRGRSDAMYHSHFEPWSHLLTGEMGKDPGWDPLQFVLDEAHRRGMEVHVWFNTFLAKSGKEKPEESKPRHVILAHPEWLKLVKGEWWLDPGIPEVREYVLKVALDIVRNYDVDGFQFDFLRYSPNNFPDDKTWKKYGHKQAKEDWRRENINKFVRAFYDSAHAIKPMMKVGATPIGIYNASVYKNGMRGFEDVSQDAKEWMKEEKMDYLVPQVYWSLKDTEPGPDFALVTKDWVKSEHRAQIYVGIGIYKDGVFRQASTLIDTSRSLGVNGEAYFRFEHTAKKIDTTQIYTTLANIPPMKWKDSIPPNPPAALKVVHDSGGIALLSWKLPKPAPDGDTATMIDIYRSEMYPVDVENAMNLIKQIPYATSSINDSGKTHHYHYAVTALDKGHNESTPLQEEPVAVSEVVTLLQRFESPTKLGNVIINKSAGFAFIPYELNAATSIKLSIWDTTKSNLQISVNELRNAGKNFTAIPLSELKNGTYLLQAESPNFTLQKQFLLKK